MNELIFGNGILDQVEQTCTTYTDPCEFCPNNPKNNKFASGVCSCTLPYLNQVIY